MLVVVLQCWFFLMMIHSSAAARTLFGRHNVVSIHQQHRHPTVGGITHYANSIARGGDDATSLQEGNLIVNLLQKFASLLWTILSAILKLVAPKTTTTKDASVDDIMQRRQQWKKDLELETIPDCLQTGTLSDALTAARREGRFLVAVSTSDTTCLQALLSDEVVRLAERKSKSVSPNGSFLLWMEYSDAKKQRMRVLASANAVLGESAPVQNPERLVHYLSDIRKRHRKVLLKRFKRRQEQVWADERRDKYSESVESDDRKQELEQLQAERRAKEAAEEIARKQAILDRRVVLNDALPDELESGGILVALRFPDGVKAQRRFVETEDMNTIFNWVDACFAHDRETVSLQTLNGKQTFTFDEALNVASLGETIGNKTSIAFRVLLQ